MTDKKTRILSVFTTLAILLTSLNINLLPAQAATDPEIYSGAAITRQADTHSIIDFANAGFVQFEPTIQTVRVSLIKANSSPIVAGSSDNRGFPVTNADEPKIKMNPIHLVPYDYSWGADKEKVYSLKNTDTNRSSAGLTIFNSRREYLATDLHSTDPTYPPDSKVISYGTKWMPDDFARKGTTVGHWVFSDSKFQSWRIATTIFPDKFIPNCISGIGGDHKAYYQDHPPTIRVQNATTTAEYLDAAAQAVFHENDPDEGYDSNGMKQCMIYHIIAYMINASDPYCDEVEEIVQKVIDNEYKVLLEPTITIKMDSQIAQGFFGDATEIRDDSLITLTAADLSTAEDVISTVWAGATSPKSSYYKGSIPETSYEGGNRYRGYNPISHNPSTAGIIEKFYNCLHLDGNHEEVGLYSPYGEMDADKLNKYLHYHGTPNEYDKTQKGSLWNKIPGPLYENPFYKQIANVIQNHGGSPQTTTCKVDMASLADNGAVYIIKPQYSTIDYAITAKGIGEQTGQVTNSSGLVLPVYEDAFDGSTNQITFKVNSFLKMLNKETNTPITQWMDKVLTVEPENYNRDLPAYNGGSYEVKDIDQTMTEVFIPAITKTEVTATYANAKGDPIAFNQVDGTSASAGSSIITKSPTGDTEKLFLDNMKYYSFDPSKNEAIPYTMTVTDAKNPNRLADTTIHAEIMSDFTPTVGTDKENYIQMTIPEMAYRPVDAAYIKVRATVNLGDFQDHSATATNIGHSAPVEAKATDGSGTTFDYPAYAYEGGQPNIDTRKTLGATEKIEAQADNIVEFLIPLATYNLSADTIAVLPVLNPPATTATGGVTPTSVNNIIISTTSSATDETAADYCGKDTNEVIYAYVSTNANDIDRMVTAINTIKENPISIKDMTRIDDYLKSSATSIGGIFVLFYKQGWATKEKLISKCPDVTPETFDEAHEHELEEDEEAGDTLNWDVESTGSDTLTLAVNKALEKISPGESVYIAAVHVINPTIPANPTMTPPMETTFQDNFQIGRAVVTKEGFEPPLTDTPVELTCYPKTSDNKWKNLTEVNNWSKCETADNLLPSEMTKDGITETSLKTAASGCMLYGASLRVDGVSNDMHLGKRTTLKFHKVHKLIVSHCNQHGSGPDKDFPEDEPTFSGWSSDGILDSTGKGGTDVVMHQELYKYLEWDDDVGKFVIKNQVVNAGYFKRGRSTCVHCGAKRCRRRTRQRWYDTMILEESQDNVYYTVLFDHNYAQSIHNSMIYSIDSLLANSKQQGVYSYMIEAGSKFGVNLQERVLSDLPSSSVISMKADAYYTYDLKNNKMNSTATQGNLAPASNQTNAGGSDTGTSPIPLFKDYSDITGNAKTLGGKSEWNKSNESYNKFLDKPSSCDGYLYDKINNSRRGEYYQFNVASRLLYMNGSYNGNDGGAGASLTQYFTDSTLDKMTGWGINRIMKSKSYMTSPSRPNSWVCTSQGDTSFDVPTVRYYRFIQPVSGNSQANGFLTNPDYPDSIKVNPNGQPIITNEEASKKFISKATAFEKAMGYVGLRVNIISYIDEITFSDGASSQPVYLKGLQYQPGGVGAGGSVIGDCTTYSLVVIGTTSNRYSAHSGKVGTN